MTTTINASLSAGVVTTADTSGILQLQTASTAALTIDASQNTGFGTTSPSYKVDVVSTGNSLNSNLASRNTTSGTAAGAQILVGNDSTNDLLVLRALSSTYTSSGVNTANGALVRGGGAGGMTLAATDASGIINFATGGTTERMRIDSSGNLLVGTTSAGSGATGGLLRVSKTSGNGIYSEAATTAAGYRYISNALSDGGTYYHFNFTEGGTQRGFITSNGSTTTYGTSSDYRLKENVQPMTGALAKVAQLKPVTYKWKESGANGQGFIAHELQAVVPDCVTGEKDEVDADNNPKYQGIDVSFLVATLTAAIQELKTINDTQAETINALTARIVALENRA